MIAMSHSERAHHETAANLEICCPNTRKESAMMHENQNRQDNNQSPDRDRDQRDYLDKELSPDIDFPEPVSGSGQTPLGG
jgi:hypothetical protein